MSDRARLSCTAKFLLLVGLVAWMFLRGVLPAFTAILAFPRLFLMLALFVVCTGAVLLPRSSEERAARGRPVLDAEASR
jgi:hypothetical protein